MTRKRVWNRKRVRTKHTPAPGRIQEYVVSAIIRGRPDPGRPLLKIPDEGIVKDYFLFFCAAFAPGFFFAGSAFFGFGSGVVFFFAVSTIFVFQLPLSLWILIMSDDRDDWETGATPASGWMSG